ncbi:Uncharacterised protein [Mycobacteroides abscessus subsp. abscessus]|nr:Uncharacterised protein [Mycobacteroides abscessus subsp. abscessus]
MPALDDRLTSKLARPMSNFPGPITCGASYPIQAMVATLSFRPASSSWRIASARNRVASPTIPRIESLTLVFSPGIVTEM